MNKRTILLILLILSLSFVLFFIGASKTKNTEIPEILSQAKASLLDATWGSVTNTSEQTPLGLASGQKVSGTLTSDKAMISHFENTKLLESMGYTLNQNLSADGPGSSMWGYTKGNKVITYSYKTAPTSSSPNEPLSFDCPCQVSVSVFTGTLSQPSGDNENGMELANPASVNCKKVGGTTVIKNGPNGQYGLCQFEDNMACEEWALLRGDCPIGGVKTTGYDTIQQMYCAWVGGETLAVKNPSCKLPNGTVCTDDAVYNGTCKDSE